MIELAILKKRLATLQTLNDDFGIPDYLEFKAGRDGLAVAEINNDHAVATLSLQGGHLMTFRPRDQDHVLWLSKFAPLDSSKPIRGGVPICWPWFGPHATDKDKPAHGFARNALWKVTETARTDQGSTQISLEILHTSEIHRLWPYLARLQLIVTVGIDLKIELITHNTGTEAFTIGEAFHTYFNVSDVSKVAIYGLKGCEYIDKVDNSRRKRQDGVVKIREETDRVYFDTSAECILEDPGLRRRIRLTKEGSLSTVIWNPWEEKAVKLGDCGHQGHLSMVCIETANALNNVVTVNPGEEHCLKTVMNVESL